LELGTVAHTCNPRYLGSADQVPAWAKSPQDPISTNKKLGVVVYMPATPATREA
jgi:hypothetical protein